jgi:NNP family nitrate/nitrite transporter-like MFS transporter
MPGLAGGTLRLVWMFLPPIMGTRKLVTLADRPFPHPAHRVGHRRAEPRDVLRRPAAAGGILAGIGGGVFSGFMPSTSYFFPRSKQGTALGIQAGIGNFGVSAVQFVTPWIIGFAIIGGASQMIDQSKDKGIEQGSLVPERRLDLGAVRHRRGRPRWFLLRSVPGQARGVKDQLDIFKNKHTWIMTCSTSSPSARSPAWRRSSPCSSTTSTAPRRSATPASTRRQVRLPRRPGRLGRAQSSPARSRTGSAADASRWSRRAGHRSACAVHVRSSSRRQQLDEFPQFLWGMLTIFFFAGVGNASTFKQMPMIFERRQAGGVIGWTSAIAAFGPFVFGVMLAYISPLLFFSLGVVFALIAGGISWWFYARPGAEKPC